MTFPQIVIRLTIPLVAMGVGVTLATSWAKRPDAVPALPQETRHIPLPNAQEIVDLTIDPSGTILAYTAIIDRRVQLIIRHLDQSQGTIVPGTDGASQPFFSPDGQSLAYFADGMLMTVRTDGGQPVEVCELTGVTSGGTWTTDGQIIFAPLGGKGLFGVPASGGTPVRLTEVDPRETEVAHGWPHALPDGKSLVLTIGRSGRNPLLALLSLETGERRSLVPAEGGASYTTSGHVLYTRRGEAFALPIDTDTLSMRGAPRPVAQAVASTAAGYGRLGHSSLAAARHGTLIYVPMDHSVGSHANLVWVDRQGEITPLGNIAAPYQTPRLSPEGGHIVVSIRTDPFSRDLWLYDPVTHRRRRLTENAGDNHSPLWSPNGQRITFASSRDGPQWIYTIPANGGLTPERLLFGDGRTPGSWSPNERILFFHEIHPTRARDIRTWSPDEGTSPRLIATAANERTPALSPNGSWLAFVSDDKGGNQIYIQSYPSTGVRQRVSPAGGTEPVWSPTGLELFYRRGREVHVVAFDNDKGVVGQPARLFDGTFLSDPNGNVPAYDVGPDGARLVMLQPSAHIESLRLLRHWVTSVFPTGTED